MGFGSFKEKLGLLITFYSSANKLLCDVKTSAVKSNQLNHADLKLIFI